MPSASRALAALVLLGLVAQPTRVAARPLTLWHSYRGAEQAALLELLDRYRATRPGQIVRAVPIAHDAYASKLTAAIPRGHGPDLFIFAHERIGSWVASKLLRPMPPSLTKGEVWAGLLPQTRQAVAYEGRHYGLPLAFKCLALFYNRALVTTPPATTDELLALSRRLRGQGIHALAYATDEFYFHAPWIFGFGGELFDAEGRPQLATPAIARSVRFVQDLVLQKRAVPAEATTALATQLFNSGKVATVINGPWFLGELNEGLDFGVAPLPKVSATGRRAKPLLTVEALMLPATSPDPGPALELARYLAGAEGSSLRATKGRQLVARAATFAEPEVARDKVLSRFRAQLDQTVPMSNRPEMNLIWEPAKAALVAAMRGVDADEALQRAERRLAATSRPPPPRVSPWPYVLTLALASLIGAVFFVRRLRRGVPLDAARPGQRRWIPYAYIAPAYTGLLFLALVPFAVALAIAFCHHKAGDFTFVGLAHFKDILFSESFGLGDPLSFYFTLVVTLLWTAANVALHVSLGLALALLLKEPWLRLRGVYRALLIIPWAVPNYITALIWKGMFHTQHGAINGLLTSLGLEPVNWFASFWTSFSANVVTNTWLGFPFMMVVALGALQAIPAELYEAATIDGAGRWQRFRHVTLPLLRPAMLPAVLLGMIWTFNMFNIVYLVSGGEPGGATEILISEAYRWAFQRQEQYGYAAAYSTLIFCILVGYTVATRRVVAKESY